AMTLITAIRSNTTIADKDYLDTNIKLKKGMYQYFGQKIYNLIINDKIGTSTEPKHYAKTIFYKALNFLPKFNEGTATLDDPLIKDNFKEPLTFLLKEVIKRENENDFTYFSRLQDTVPLKINNNFLDGSILITQYYVDLLKA
ncbi:hypothetical protein CRV00_14605, partial [Malaciobacter molluscorum]